MIPYHEKPPSCAFLNISAYRLKSVSKDKVATLEKEKEILLLKLECAEKLNAVHNFYNNIKT